MSEAKPTSGEFKMSEEKDYKLPVLGWNKSDVKTFQDLWASMIGTTNEELRTLGVNLLIWMFEHVPNMKALFKHFDASGAKGVLISDEKFLKHAQRVVVQLNKLIKSLDEPTIIDDIRLLAKAHLRLKPQVTAQYFEEFRDRFHALVFEMTGTGKDEQPAVLWYQFLNAFYVIFKEEEDLFNSTENKKIGGCCVVT